MERASRQTGTTVPPSMIEVLGTGRVPEGQSGVFDRMGGGWKPKELAPASFAFHPTPIQEAGQFFLLCGWTCAAQGVQSCRGNPLGRCTAACMHAHGMLTSSLKRSSRNPVQSLEHAVAQAGQCACNDGCMPSWEQQSPGVLVHACAPPVAQQRTRL